VPPLESDRSGDGDPVLDTTTGSLGDLFDYQRYAKRAAAVMITEVL
jgi:hypothetical protein